MTLRGIAANIQRKAWQLYQILMPFACLICSKLGTLWCFKCKKHLLTKASLKKYAINNWHVHAMFNFKDVKHLLHLIKFDQHIQLASSLGNSTTINNVWRAHLNSTLSKHSQSKLIIIAPVPLHKRRLKKRGFNQVMPLFVNIPHSQPNKAVGLTPCGSEAHRSAPTLFCPDLFIRTKSTIPLFKLTKEERGQELQQAFSINHDTLNSVLNTRNVRAEDCLLFIADDICTTGQTLLNLKACASSAGFEHIYALAFAYQTLENQA